MIICQCAVGVNAGKYGRAGDQCCFSAAIEVVRKTCPRSWCGPLTGRLYQVTLMVIKRRFSCRPADDSRPKF